MNVGLRALFHFGSFAMAKRMAPVHLVPTVRYLTGKYLFVLAVVPVFYPALISIYFFFAIFYLGGSGLVFKFEGGFYFPFES